MGLTQTSVLAIVFDITGSLSAYIAEAKTMLFNFMDSMIGTSDEPSEYMLVLFNDLGKHIVHEHI